MRRRTLLSTVALVGTGLAGCLGENRPGQGNVAGTPNDDADPTATESNDDTDRGPEATAVAFFDAFDSGDADRVNGFRHPEASMDPMTDEQAANLASDPVTVETTELVEGGDTSASVEALVHIGTAAADTAPRSYSVELRSEDGEWLIWSMRLTPPGESSIVPTAAFEFDHGDGTETIEHAGGDQIPADRLYVRGDGLDATGSWADLGGEASADVGGEPAVTDGDSLTVGVESSYSIRIVSETEDGTAAILTEMSAASESSSASSDSGTSSDSAGTSANGTASDGS